MMMMMMVMMVMILTPFKRRLKQLAQAFAERATMETQGRTAALQHGLAT